MMLKLRSALLAAILIFGGACALLLTQFRAASQQTEQHQRLIDEKGSYSNCPIRIVGVETARGKVVLGKPFSGDDDWMKGITVRVENVSGRVLTHLGIKITIDRPADQINQPRASWDLWYGVSPFFFKPGETIPPPLVRLIQPGETESIALADKDYDAMRALLRDFKFPSSIETIHISVYTIGFADGTAWAGQLYRRDPGALHGWTPVDLPQGSARNRAAFSYLLLMISYNNEAPLGWKSTGRMTSVETPSSPDVPCGAAAIATNTCPNQPLRLLV